MTLFCWSQAFLTEDFSLSHSHLKKALTSLLPLSLISSKNVAIFITDPLNLPLNHTLTHRRRSETHFSTFIFCCIFLLFSIFLSLSSTFSRRKPISQKRQRKKNTTFFYFWDFFFSLTLSHAHTVAQLMSNGVLFLRFFLSS